METFYSKQPSCVRTLTEWRKLNPFNWVQDSRRWNKSMKQREIGQQDILVMGNGRSDNSVMGNKRWEMVQQCNGQWEMGQRTSCCYHVAMHEKKMFSQEIGTLYLSSDRHIISTRLLLSHAYYNCFPVYYVSFRQFKFSAIQDVEKTFTGHVHYSLQSVMLFPVYCTNLNKWVGFSS